MLQSENGVAPKARFLRRSMTLPEVLLWRELRARPGQFKFRRQHPSGPYIADFYCHEARLIIEIDGEAHACGDRPSRDAERDRWFAARGILTLRLPASLVLVDLEAAVTAIVDTATLRRSPLGEM